MKPHDMSLGLASYPYSVKLGYWLTRTGRLSFSGWKRLPVPYVVSTSFQEVVGVTGNVSHEVLRFVCLPRCCFWVALVWWDVLESSPQRCWKMVFSGWKVRQRLLVENVWIHHRRPSHALQHWCTGWQLQRGLVIWSGNHFDSSALNFCVRDWAREFLYCLKANFIALKRYKCTSPEVFFIFVSSLCPFVMPLSWFGTEEFPRNPLGRVLLLNIAPAGLLLYQF